MASRRRYPITDKTRAYHDTFDRERIESDILNSGDKKPNIHTLFLGDRRTLLSLELELEGKDSTEGYTDEQGNVRLGAIPSLRVRLEEVERDWNNHRQLSINAGRPAPKDWPPELLERKLKLEARLDVREEELQVVQKWLKGMEDRKESERTGEVLKYGLRGTAQLNGGKIVTLDGQRVSETPEGVFYIDEPSSKYDGMSTVTYFGLVKEADRWRREKLKQMREEAAKDGSRNKPIPSNLRGPLPDWPKDAVNYKNKNKTK